MLWCGVVCWLAFFFPPQSWHQNHFPECHHTTGRVCDHSGPLGVQLCSPPPRSSAPMLIPPYPKETKGPHILGAGLSASRNPKLFLRKPELGKGQRKKKGSLSPGVVMSPTEIQRSQPVPTSHTWECPITTPPTYKQKLTKMLVSTAHRTPLLPPTVPVPLQSLQFHLQPNRTERHTPRIHIHTPKDLFYRQHPETWEATQCDPQIRTPHWDSHPGKG